MFVDEVDIVLSEALDEEVEEMDVVLDGAVAEEVHVVLGISIVVELRLNSGSVVFE